MASQKRSASIKQGKRERNEESEPDWSSDTDNEEALAGGQLGEHTFNNFFRLLECILTWRVLLDEVAMDLLADEQKRQHLIKKIRKRDKRDDHINMDEDELQRIWDQGEGKGKKKANLDMFGEESKVRDLPSRSFSRLFYGLLYTRIGC